jgi:hypothetical protein
MRRLILGISLLMLVSGCATTQPQAPQIQRISPEELEQIMPKPVPNLSLNELVVLSNSGISADEIIERIKATDSRYELTPSQALQLSKEGVDSRVLDYIHASREQALRDGVAEEINKREQQKQQELERVKRDYQLRSYPYYYPYFGYGYYPWRHPRYSPYYGIGIGW